ncbi:MAG: lipid-A-disaccharide synthase [Candidatus Omnitrophica bacterium]|nr:lipid-A-disaccharide synthase [Candidatus Omnitrophota bacterium]
MPKKIYLIACEASGDLHAAELIAAFRERAPEVEFRGLGGPQTALAGMTVLEDMTKISALGLSDVLRQYFRYRKIFYRTLADLKHWQPDALILVDSPAFNLRLAKKVKKALPQLPILYYICPQIWAWGHRRIVTVKKNISKMFSILPFEVDYYQKAKVPCEFVGHPLLDHVKTSADRTTLRKDFGIATDELAVGLLPGSRSSEVRRILPVMLKTAGLICRDVPQIIFYIARSDNVEDSVYDDILAKAAVPFRNIHNRFYDYVSAMDFALVASGTATLQTALVGTPFFLLYKASLSTYLLGKQLIRVPYLGLVNLLAGRPIVPEFIQYDAHPETIAHEAKFILLNAEYRQKMQEEFAEVRENLGKGGASRRAADAMLTFLASR